MSGEQCAQSTSWESVGVTLGEPGSRYLILCDHATNQLPPEYGMLGLDPSQLERHIGYDIGALSIAREIGRRLKATVVSSCFLRLLIDPNRGEDDPTLIMQLSDGAIVPGNAAISKEEQERRIVDYYLPYHGAITGAIDAMLRLGLTPVIVSIHSFTEAWRGVPRKWAAAVLWDRDPRLAVPLIEELRRRTNFEIGDNEPYTGRLRNDGIYRHATLRGLPNALIEVRQDLIREAEGQAQWAAILSDCLAAISKNPAHAEALARVEYYGSHTDIEGRPKEL